LCCLGKTSTSMSAAGSKECGGRHASIGIGLCKLLNVNEKEIVSFIRSWWRTILADRAERRRVGAEQALAAAAANAIIFFQASWRSALAKRQLQTASFAAVMVQACWRSALAKHQLRAVMVQACWRSALAKHQPREARIVAVMVQSCWRCSLTKRQLRYFAAVMVQACWGSALAKPQLREARIAAFMVQSCWRSALAKRQLRDMLLSWFKLAGEVPWQNVSCVKQ
jgi:hypothetical protein